MKRKIIILIGFLLTFGLSISLRSEDNKEMKFPLFIYAGSAFRSHYATLHTIPYGINEIKEMNCQGINWLLRRANGAWEPDYWMDKENAQKFISITKSNGMRNVYWIVGMWTMPREISKGENLWTPISKEYLKKHNASLSINDPETLALTFKAYGQIFEKYGKDIYGVIPGDEPSYDAHNIKKNEDDLREYKRYLKENLSRKTLKAHGMEDLGKIELPTLETRTKNPFLWSTFYDFIDKSMVRYFTKQKEFFHRVNPNIKMIGCISPISYLSNPLSCSFSKLAPVYDIIQTDLYTGCCGTVEGERSLIYEMLEYANPGRVWPVPGTYYHSYPWQLKRRIYLAGMHADGVSTWCYLHAREATAPYTTKETKEIYQAVKESYGELSRIENYLYKSQTISPVGIIFSEKTVSNRYAGWENTFPYFANISGYWIMSLRDHIPMRALILDTLTPDKLKDFKVLILPDAECISNKQIETLKGWVRKGGILISDGRTSLYTEHGIKRENYGLKDVFGVNYKGENFHPNRILNWKGKKFIYYKNAPSMFKDISSSSKSILYTSPVLSPLDNVHLISRYQDMTPAILFNPYGKGGCILITAPYLGIKSFGEDIDSFTYLWKEIIDLALEKVKTKLPVYMLNCPEEIEINLREQNFGMHKNRILHLVASYEANLNSPMMYSGISAKIRIPENYKVLGVIDPTTNRKIPYQEGKEYIEFKVPDFKLYKCIVLKMVKGRREIKRELPSFSVRKTIKKEKEKRLPQSLMSTLPRNINKEIKVGILNVHNQGGAKGIYETLKEIKGIQPECINTIDLSILKDKDVLIYPAIYNFGYEKSFATKEVRDNWKRWIQKWVREGHGLLSLHNAIGYRYSGRSLFPEISRGGLAHPTVPYFTPVVNSPITEGLKIGQVYPDNCYIDHIQIKKGKEGYVVARDYILGRGNPVIVVGSAGRGRYVACGLHLGKSMLPNLAGKKGLPLSGAELKLLVNSVRWLAYPAIIKGEK